LYLEVISWWFDRYIEKSMLSAVKSRPVVLLTGARQTGTIAIR